MNIFLLITVSCTLALGYAQQGEASHRKPCQLNKDTNAYNKFVYKHIIREKFDRNSVTEWERYLRDRGLCDRHTQIFMEVTYQNDVNAICNGYGRRLKRNLCISTKKIEEYTLKVGKKCKVIKLRKESKYLVVACDKVKSENACLPVQFKKTRKHPPPSSAKKCSPSTSFWSDD